MQNTLKVIYYECMSSPLQIRDIPDPARRALKARAASRGQSLNRYMLDMIEREVARPTVAEVLDRAARRAEQATSPAADVIQSGRAARDAESVARASA